MIVGGIEEIRLDEPAHELYAADNYLGGRVMVFDLDTLKFKRGWGAYGHTLSEMSTNDADRAYTPGGPEPKEFRGHLTLNISNDGLVYAADRMANRIQVTTKQGKFMKGIHPGTHDGRGRFHRRRHVLGRQRSSNSSIFPISRITTSGSSIARTAKWWAKWEQWAKMAANSSACT